MNCVNSNCHLILKKQTIMEEVKSPCIKICKTDSNGVCYGCRRTKEEIGDWGLYTNTQKQAVLDQLPTRTNADDDATGFAR